MTPRLVERREDINWNKQTDLQLDKHGDNVNDHAAY